MELRGIGGAGADRRRLVKRLLCLATLSLLALLILAPDARAQSGDLESQGITLPCPSQLDRFPEGTVCGEGGAYIDLEDETAAEPLPRPGSLESLGITQPCPGQLDRFPEGTVCGEGGSYLSPVTGRGAQPLPENGGEPSGEGGTYTCGDFTDQGQAQEAFGRALRGDPEFPLDPAVVDPDGDGIACEGLPTAFDPNGTYTCENFLDQARAQAYFNEFLRDDPEADRSALDPDGNGIACEDEDLPTDDASDEGAGEETPPADGEVSVGEGTEGEQTRRERRERTGAEETRGAEEQPADEGGSGEGGSGEGGSGGGGNGSAGSGEGEGASQGGVSGAVSDGFGSVLSGRLPNTGGGWAVLLLAGAVLIGGGVFLVRRFSSST